MFGCIDEMHVDDFRERMRQASDDYRSELVVDLSEAEFLPSMAIGAIVGAGKRLEAAGMRLQLVARAGTIAHRVLEICGLPFREPPQHAQY